MSAASEKEIVIRLSTYDFALPAGHENVVIEGDSRTIKLLAAGGARGSTFELRGSSDQPDKIIYEVGTKLEDEPGGAYPIPAIQEEIQRLIDAYIALGGQQTDVTAWAEGSGYRQHLAFLRGKVRGLARPTQAD